MVKLLGAEWCVVSTTEDYEYSAKGFNTYSEMKKWCEQGDDGSGWSPEYIYHKGKPRKFQMRYTAELLLEEY